MTYDPKIYIRDYPEATVYALVSSGQFSFTGYPITVLRNLRAEIQGPEDGFLLLEGDMQSGSDYLLLEGDETGGLLLDGSEASGGQFRMTGNPINVAFGVVSVPMAPGSFIISGQDIAVEFTGELTLEGDMQSGADALLLEGDMQSDVDTLITEFMEP